MLFKKIKDIDSNKLAKECNDLIDSIGFNNTQLCLQYSAEVSWHDDVDHYGKTRFEHECTNFHPDLDGTYIKEVLCGLDFPVASARLMWLDKRSCYSTHVDLYTRYHIPIVSNPMMAYMVFPDIPFVARMDHGAIYWTNTHELHNFVNGDHSPRVHLIFNDATELPNYDNRYLEILHGDKFTRKST